MSRIDGTSEPFFKHLHANKTHHVIITGETDEADHFDDVTIQQWKGEGFRVHYVHYAEGGLSYIRRLHALADEMVGISEQYAIVAFGDAASACLEAHIKAAPRLIAIVAYYPAIIPSPAQTTYPMQMSVLMHLCGTSIGLWKTREVLGIQGKRTQITKTLEPGLGLGGELDLNFAAYTYEGVDAGFAERDLDEFDPMAAGLAWTRSLQILRQAFGVRADVERVRDQHWENTTLEPEKAGELLVRTSHVLNTPTMTGGFNASDLESFYADFFAASAPIINTTLLSRTVGTDRVVDEMLVEFDHEQEIPWILPGIPPTDKFVEIVVVSIVAIKAGKLESEHLYWDQASVLMQVGLLDPMNVPEAARKRGVKRLPVVGNEAARAVEKGAGKVNALLSK